MSKNKKELCEEFFPAVVDLDKDKTIGYSANAAGVIRLAPKLAGVED